MKKQYLLTSSEVIEAATKLSKKRLEDFTVDSYVILYFSDYLMNYLAKKISMKKFPWLEEFHPYSSGEVYRGKFQEIPITAVKPTMGASPLSSTLEDLITCGARTILLVCGAWGIGRTVKLLDFLIPTHTTGFDGTSFHYGKRKEKEAKLLDDVMRVFEQETKKRTVNYHLGKNFAKEALYRLEREEIVKLQGKGFISIENGELNVLATICSQKSVKFGAIFYSYYNPLERWTAPWVTEENHYKEVVDLEGEITLATIGRIEKELEPVGL